MKKIISLVLCIVLSITVLGPSLEIFAFKPATQSVKGITPYNVQTVDLNEIQTIKSPLAFSEYLHQEMLNCSTYVDISSYQIPYSDEGRALIGSVLYNEHIDCYHISNGYQYYYNSSYITALLLTYNYTAEEFEELNAEIVTVSNYLLRDLNTSTISQAEKALLVHDRLVAWTEYDYLNLKNKSLPPTVYSILGPFIYRSAVCAGYAKAYMHLMRILGFECSYVNSDLNNHAWAMLTVDGEKYFVDCSNDDPVWDIYGRVRHTNFLKSAAKFATISNHKPDENGDFDYTQEPTSTIYDDYYWDSVNAEFQFVNGKFYYVHLDDIYTGKINKIDNGTTTTIVNIPLWVVKGSIGGGSYSYSSNLTRLTSDENYLYYSTSEEIRKYNLQTGEDTSYFAPTLGTNPDGRKFTPIGFKKDGCVLTIDINDSSENYMPDESGARYVYGVSQGMHSYLNYLKTTTKHWQVCTLCGEATEKINHEYQNYFQISEPTCTCNGVEMGTCICGETITREIENSQLPHFSPFTYSVNELGHKKKCGCGLLGENEPHIAGDPPTDTTGQYCTVCNYMIAPALSVTLTSVSVNTQPKNLYFNLGEEITAEKLTGLTLSLNYSDGTSKIIESGYTISGYENTKVGEQFITLTYNESTTTLRILVNKPSPRFSLSIGHSNRITRTFGYKTPIRFIAITNLTNTNPYIWYVDDEKQNTTGPQLVVSGRSGSYSVRCATTDEYGNLIETTVNAVIRNSFFDKIIYFFRSIFGGVREETF